MHSVFTAPKICAPSIHPSFPPCPTPAAIDIFAVSIVYLFQNVLWLEPCSFVFSPDWLFSLSNVHLRFHVFSQGFPNGPVVKNPPAKQKICIRSLGRKDPLEKEMAAHSSILAWRIPWTEELDRLQLMVSQRVGHDWSNLAHTHKYQHKALQLTKGSDCVFQSDILISHQTSCYLIV